jgi:hypothetical protein
MKRKSARPKTTKTRASLPVKHLWDRMNPELRGLFGDTHSYEDISEKEQGFLPSDLEQLVAGVAAERVRALKDFGFKCPQNWLSDIPGGDRFDPPRGGIELPAWAWLMLEECVRAAIRAGYFFALMRYADDLATSSEAGPVLEKMRRGAKKGGESRREKSRPRREAIRKLFRELRKTVPKKTARHLRLAQQFGMSERQVARIVDGID